MRFYVKEETRFVVADVIATLLMFMSLILCFIVTVCLVLSFFTGSGMVCK